MTKSYNGNREDRTLAYRNWHRENLPSNCYVMDMDQVEYKFVDGVPVPVIAIELSRVDTGTVVSDNYLAAVLHRFVEKDAQGKAAKTFAALLGVRLVLVLFAQDLSRFWLYNITDGGPWLKTNQDKYKQWLAGLR